MASEKNNFKEAVLWEKSDDNKVHCYLCRWNCIIAEDKFGACFVRKNIAGKLYSLNYDKICAANTDPIEKKPLFHFLPGSQSFSIATVGCNFRCEFCQNWQISQAAMQTGEIEGQSITPAQIVSYAEKSRCKSIAYTYTEPTIFMELCADTGKIAKEHGLKNVFVSNGYMTKEAIDFASPWLDAINVDLKAFSESYYRKLCKARLQPVLDTISYIAKNTNIWIEVTTLVIPGQNDSREELKQVADFLVEKAGPDVPWHISRFFPNYHMDGIAPTPIDTIEMAEQIGKEAGLHYVYPGNIQARAGESTYCHNCNRIVIERSGYRIISNRLEQSRCPDCGTVIAGVFD